MSHDALAATLERLSARGPYDPDVLLRGLAEIARAGVVRVRFDGSVRRLVAEHGELELDVPAEPSLFRHLLARAAMLAVGPAGLYGFEPTHVVLAPGFEVQISASNSPKTGFWLRLDPSARRTSRLP